MPTGTPNFEGARLREAREARQLTATALAELIGVTTSAISSYEKDHNSPSADVLEKISTQLRLKTEFFLRPMEDESITASETIFERSKSTATKATRLRARHRRIWLRESLQYLTGFVKLPEPDVPDLGEGRNWMVASGEKIELAALTTRQHWRLGEGPISNVTLLTENNGVIVTSFAMNAANLDAFSTWDPVDGRPYIVLGNDGQSAFRTRFNVCHELAHLVLHRNVTPTEFEDKNLFKIIETQADKFAAAFLTPASTFSQELRRPSLDGLRALKPRWKTSIKQMIHRAQDLDIISREEARNLYINYNRRRWNIQEPLDDAQDIEEPVFVRRVFEAVIENGVIERSQLAAALPFNTDEIEELAGLPYGYLHDDSAYTWAIRQLNSGFEKE